MQKETQEKKTESDRKEAVEQWSGQKRQGTDCEQEDGVTAANQISLSLGCLMSIFLCDSHLHNAVNHECTLNKILYSLCSPLPD